MTSQWRICRHDMHTSSIYDEIWQVLPSRPSTIFEISYDGQYLISCVHNSQSIDIINVSLQPALICTLSPIPAFHELGILPNTGVSSISNTASLMNVLKSITSPFLLISNSNRRVACVYEHNEGYQTRQYVVVWDTSNANIISRNR